MTSLWLDVRYALRTMLRSPGLTTVLVMTLALGIGASTAIFSVVNSVILKPLPYKQPDRLVRVYTEFLGKTEASSFHSFSFSLVELKELQEACRSCESVAGWLNGSASLSGGERPVRIKAAYATHELLPLLGVEPELGRWFDANEDSPGHAPDGQVVGDPTVVVISHELWQRVFAGDRAIIGREVFVDGIPVNVIGVMPPRFDFLDGQDAWIPARVDFAKVSRGGHSVNVIARLRPDASLQSLQDELAALTKQWAPRNSKTFHSIDDNHPMRAAAFKQDLIGSLSTTLWLLQGAVLFVLLISIVNVASLLLARAETRSREVAIRHALGANRRRLVRQFVTESLVLGILGGTLGALLSTWAVEGVAALVPSSAPRASEITVDGDAALFALGCSLFAALLFGLAPIFHARRTDLHGALKESGTQMTSSRVRLRVRRGLVITEIALAVVLVLGCTVMVRSFVKLQRVDLGYEPEHVLSFGIQLPMRDYPGATPNQLWERVEQRMRSLPNVESSGLLMSLYPNTGINAESFTFPGRTRAEDEPAWVLDTMQLVSPTSLETLGARIVKGRSINASDVDGAPRVVVVNEAFVRKFLPGREPIGTQIALWSPRETPPPDKIATIVGVVADLKNAGVERPAGTELFMPRVQLVSLNSPPVAPLMLYAVVRTSGDPEDLIPTMLKMIREIDPRVPLYEIRALDDLLWEAVARPRFLAFLLTCFAGIALVLAGVGIYGVMAHTVLQRTREIGLRMALGALPAQVRTMVLRQASTLVATGVALGLVAAVALEQVMSSSLAGVFYGGRITEPLLLAAVALGVGVIAFLATWIPVRRATRIEPTIALRAE